MKEEKYHITLDKYEHGVMINALNELRTDQIQKQRPTDAVDELIIKTAHCPQTKSRFGSKKSRVTRSDDAR